MNLWQNDTEYRAILVHWAEIALKGKNRPKFVAQLVNNLRRALVGMPVAEIRKLPSRLWITAHGGEHFGPEMADRLATVCGISSYSPVVRCGVNLDEIKACALKLVQHKTYQSFRVSARRAFKDLPLSSLEVNREVGAYLWEHKPAKVQMKDAELELHIEMLPQGAYLYTDKIPGIGGLPVGVTGKVCALLSGGIDSPVAAYRLMRRGCKVVFVHFHGQPYVSEASLEKACELGTRLSRMQAESVFYDVAFGTLQGQIVDAIEPPLRVVLYRRFMLRIAGALAKAEGCRALVTGDSLAQVASQTLTNLITIEQAAPMPVLRPLIGMDKIEIIAEAQRIGTFEISILPDQDCCTLFTPKHPETHARLARVLEAEAKLDVAAMVEAAVQTARRRKLTAPWLKRPTPPVAQPET